MPEPETLSDRIRSWAHADPTRVALETHGGSRQSYGALDAAIDVRVEDFAGAGAIRGSRVLLEARRSDTFVISLLACWRMGASAVLLDPDRPPGLEAALLARLESFVDARTICALADPGDDARRRPPRRIDPDSEAYICFTSGSTGTPKGVRIAHRGLPHLWARQAELFRTARESRTSWLLAAHFDASISDIGVPLWSGATLVILPDHSPTSALEFVEAAQLTHVDLPPSMLATLAAEPARFPCLETIIVGGEPAPAAALRDAAQSFRVINVYGPTETTVCASAEVVEPGTSARARPSIGTPLPGVSFHLARRDDAQGRGELLISGWGVGLGYVGDDAATAAAFIEVPGPAQESKPARAYRTGDLAERGDDGQWTFHGRVDRQVQLRGKRLELGEIEAALCAAPGIAGAAAVLVEDPAPHVVAIVEGPAASASAAAAERLEPWKRPSRIESTSGLPRLASGKVHIQAVESLVRSDASTAEAPATDALAEAWRAVLGRCSSGASDEDFFELGGDSVRVLEFVIEASRRGVAVPADALERGRTLGGLRSALRSGVTVAELDARARAIFAALELARDSRAPARSTKTRGSVLLTGATGLLGRALLGSSAFGDREVVTLVRGRNSAHAKERMERTLGAPLPAWLQVERGDVGLPLLGLSAETLQAHDVGDLIHAAGAVDLVRSYASLEDTNVLGTARAMEAASRLGARFHHVSTLSIFVESELEEGEAQGSQTITEATELSPAARVQGGYAQTKYVADALARRYPHGGSVLRLGLLADPEGAGVGAAAASDQLSRVIRGAAELGAWPEHVADRRFDVTPVDRAAALLAHVVRDDKTRPAEPIHLAAAGSGSGSLLLRAMEQEGVRLSLARAWPPVNWRSASAGSSDIAVALAGLALSGPGLPRSGDLFLATDRSFQCEYAARNCPSALPDPPSVELLRQCVRTANREPLTESPTR